MTGAITRTVWILSIVSLCADVSSEMLYPVMPVYLKSIGFSVLLIGILEGIAEAVAGLSKGYFGKLSDITGKRVPFVRSGYFLSAIAKPLLVTFTAPVWVFIVRTTDRIGKGLRTGARDAILSDESTAENKGKVFGFHRSMDTFGAAAGPLIALVFLYSFPEQYYWLFIFAFIPGLLSVLLTFLIKEPVARHIIERKRVSFFYSFQYLKESSAEYKRTLVGLIAFALINSSDVFLLLMVKQKGYDDIDLLTLYIFYNLVYALFAYPFGRIADRAGLKNVFIMGLLFFILTYSGFIFFNELYIFYILFFFYGLFAAASDGISRAWISNICEKKDTGIAIGTYAGFQSIAALLASSVAGLIWFGFFPELMFIVSAAGAVLVLIYFLIIRR